MKHLDPDVAEIARSGDTERIKYLNKEDAIWITYPHAKECLDLMFETVNEDANVAIKRIAIVAHTGNGKSYLITHFQNVMARKYEAEPPDSLLPIIRIQHPSTSSEGRLFNKILKATRTPFRESESAARKEVQVHGALEKLKTKLIILDDAHDAATGSKDSQKHYLAVLRNLMESTKVSFVLAGTEKILPFLNVDEQIRRRVDICALPRWMADRTFRILLNSFERKLPLREPSNLSDLRLAELICHLSDGLIQQVSKLLRAASIHAIKTGVERIDFKVIEKCNWTPLRDKIEEVANRMK